MSLSKNQSRRLAALLAIMSRDKLPLDALKEVVDSGYVDLTGGVPTLTASGLDEKNRLCTLAGLVIKYSDEKKPSNQKEG